MSSTDATPAPRSYASPFFWVPSSYLAMGLIYVTVSGVANIMFKNMGMTDAEAARWSSLFVLPYVIKPLWAPALEIYKTKRFFVLLMQTLLVGAVVAIALTLKVPGVGWTPILLLLGLAGLLGATQDIASDGVYVTTLGPKEQARYTGVQSMCWNAGPILANGALVWLSGLLFRTFHSGSFSLGALLKFAWQGGGEQVNVGAVSDPLQQALVRNHWAQSWMVIFLITAALMALLLIYHTRLLPTGSKAQDAPESFGAAMRTYGHAFSSFFQKEDIWKMLAFALLFRLGYGFLEKMVPLFMIGSRETGGLGLTNEVLGQINGIFGTGAFMVGSILGGLIVARLGLRKTLVWLCLSMNVPNVVYVYLSMTRDARYPVVATLDHDRQALLGHRRGRPDRLHDAADLAGAVPHRVLHVRLGHHGAQHDADRLRERHSRRVPGLQGVLLVRARLLRALARGHDLGALPPPRRNQPDLGRGLGRRLSGSLRGATLGGEATPAAGPEER